MFLKQKRSEMDDFERRKEFGGKGKIVQYFKKIMGKFSKILTDTLAKISQNIISYSCVSEHSKHFYFSKNKFVFFSVR